MTSDIQAFSGNGPPFVVTYVEDNSGPDLLLNVSIAYPGAADQASQVSMTSIWGVNCTSQRIGVDL